MELYRHTRITGYLIYIPNYPEVSAGMVRPSGSLGISMLEKMHSTDLRDF